MKTKAQIGTTLSWVGAMVIIFFVMLLFISASGYLASIKGGSQTSVSSSQSSFKVRTLESFLETPTTTVDGKTVKMRERIVEEMDDYRPLSYKAEDFIKEIQDILEGCPFDYSLKLPFVIIYRFDGRRYSQSSGGGDILEITFSSVNSATEDIPYRGHLIEIKLWMKNE